MHSNDIIHHDLKPQNILVSRGVVKIGGFGLSRAIDDNIMLSTQVSYHMYEYNLCVCVLNYCSC